LKAVLLLKYSAVFNFMRFDIITIFPHIFDSYFKESILARAQKNELITINVHNLRKYGEGKHKVLDDKPYGGGFGMVMKVEPVFKAIKALQKSSAKKKKKSKIVLFTPRGKKFDQKMAYQFSKLDQLILLCGRYEGIDQRISKVADVELSIGDYDLMGGEIPTMAVIETISRLIPGVIGKPQLLDERIPRIRGRGGRGFIEYPQYTRPEVFSPEKGVSWRVPKVLLTGDHKKIKEWREQHGKVIEK
jgi:tRNA (guanine37-N1)-methyltransferase